MLIKEADDRSADLAALESLLSHPETNSLARQRIEKELRTMRAGMRGEREAAYEIDFHHRPSRRWAVIHDLRLEFQGRVAQIDHILVNRCLDVWVCESKHFSEGVSINEAGEFTAFFNKQPFGVPSPLEQNRKHATVLSALFASSMFQLPTRLGMAIRPKIHAIVLVSKQSRITRPKVRIDGLDGIIKTDQLRTLIESRYDGESTAATLISATKLIGEETLEAFARQLASFHRPILFDWRGKFGLAPDIAPRVVAVAGPVTKVDETKSQRGPSMDVASKQSQPARPTDAATGVKDDPNIGRLSTSKMAAKLGFRSSGALLQNLTAQGFLTAKGETHELTDAGRAAGAVFVEKSRYGPYFLWPESFKP